ncbi:unnamed protein product [Dibothriocephalus latus]|uniref:Uncharacterized protein n=1 Tax=Dibothriocephalus latus TaxID=60516 RepID=A0A3P7PBU2_DIBLA|nr:unnamed protein product [Dibothriocephalus latus]
MNTNIVFLRLSGVETYLHDDWRLREAEQLLVSSLLVASADAGAGGSSSSQAEQTTATAAVEVASNAAAIGAPPVYVMVNGEITWDQLQPLKEVQGDCEGPICTEHAQTLSEKLMSSGSDIVAENRNCALRSNEDAITSGAAEERARLIGQTIGACHDIEHVWCLCFRAPAAGQENSDTRTADRRPECTTTLRARNKSSFE